MVETIPVRFPTIAGVCEMFRDGKYERIELRNWNEVERRGSEEIERRMERTDVQGGEETGENRIAKAAYYCYLTHDDITPTEIFLLEQKGIRGLAGKDTNQAVKTLMAMYEGRYVIDREATRKRFLLERVATRLGGKSSGLVVQYKVPELEYKSMMHDVCWFGRSLDEIDGLYK
mmetsp:Transcript_12496/g.35292  ORF Transcript_12496/g.35292 Transcript_12496/m.35292 type:complete len:174 (+) Transcript_12496:69-590(+)